MTIDVIKSIAAKFITELNTELKKKKITVTITDSAIAHLTDKGYSIEMGARPLKRFIQDNITNKLSDEILFGKLTHGGEVKVDFDKKLTLIFSPLDTRTK